MRGARTRRRRNPRFAALCLLLIFAAVVLAQLPLEMLRRVKKAS